MDTETTYTVRKNPARDRYELLDGETVVGTALFVPYDGAGSRQRIFYHTAVDGNYSGQGLASKLARASLDDTIAAGLSIVPVCPYITAWLAKHRDYLPHAVAVRPEHLAAVPRPTKRSQQPPV